MQSSRHSQAQRQLQSLQLTSKSSARKVLVPEGAVILVLRRHRQGVPWVEVGQVPLAADVGLVGRLELQIRQQAPIHVVEKAVVL